MNWQHLPQNRHLSPGAALRSALLRVLVLTCPRRQVKGFQVVDACASGELEFLCSKVHEALLLIETHDPTRFARLRRDLKRFALIAGGGEFYHHGLRAYIMDVPNMKTRSAPELASTIVHEATHARLALAGISTKKENVERIEHICTEAAASFADRTPGGQSLATHLRAQLSTRWWVDDAMRARRLEQLRAAGFPHWILGLYRRLFVRKSSSQNEGR